MLCFECGVGTLALRDIKGQVRRYRDLARVTILESCIVPACDRCSEMLLDGRQTQRFDAVMQPSYLAERRRQMQSAVEQFTARRSTTQGVAEKLLGLSQGYLSKLIHGDREPDVQTFRHVRGLPELTDAAVTLLAEDAGLEYLLPEMVGGAGVQVAPRLSVSTAAADAEAPKRRRQKTVGGRSSTMERSSIVA